MASSISVKYSLRSRTTCRGAVASTHGVKSRRSANRMVASVSSPSPRMRPARISSRISGVTYLPKVSLTISRSRSPCSIRFTPSAAAPISSVVTTGAWSSRWPRATRAMAASTSFSGAATLLAAKRERPIAAATPTPRRKTMESRRPLTISAAAQGPEPAPHPDPEEEDEGEPQAVDDLGRRGRVGAAQLEGLRVGQHAQHRERHDAGQQEDGQQPDPHRQPRDAGHGAQVALGKERGHRPPPVMLAGEEDEGDGHAARDDGGAEDQPEGAGGLEGARHQREGEPPGDTGQHPASEVEAGQEVREQQRAAPDERGLRGREHRQIGDAVERTRPGPAEPH